MASSREIRRRIRSVKNVAQITRAMEMVAASKMRRAQRNVLATRPYADRLREVLGNLTNRMVGGRRGTLLENRPAVRTVGLVVVTPDRGLCGSLISNVLRRVGRFILDQRQQGRNVALYTIGKKGRDFLVRTNQQVLAEIIKIGDAPSLADTLGISTNVINAYNNGVVDEVYIVYSEFINTLVQRPSLKRLIPIEPPANDGAQRFDFNYEPSQEEVLAGLLPRYVETQVYQAILESIASFYSAQMVAMRAATDSAKDLVRDLTLSYNKTRQANITKEVSEISAGTVAMEEA
ncbi:MAG: F0F1 ATP synthase subunit gamma [Chloroflexales bacterium]|nr:F0F1 ATP synthase subunit gamma [Chloroflexales bacterium]